MTKAKPQRYRVDPAAYVGKTITAAEEWHDGFLLTFADGDELAVGLKWFGSEAAVVRCEGRVEQLEEFSMEMFSMEMVEKLVEDAERSMGFAWPPWPDDCTNVRPVWGRPACAIPPCDRIGEQPCDTCPHAQADDRENVV